MNILDIHSKCLDFLLDYQLKTKDFYFVPRKINNKNRLAQGMYFRGNEEYLVLSFWDSADTKEFIYNVNFSVSDKGCASQEKFLLKLKNQGGDIFIQRTMII